MQDTLEKDSNVLLDAEIAVEQDRLASSSEEAPLPETEAMVENNPAPACDPRLIERLDGLQAGLIQIVDAVGKTSEQLSFLPGQIRNLGGRVDAVAVSISETRYRTLLMDILGIYDLLDQLIRSVELVASEADRQHLKNYRILQTQMVQILEYNGLSRISTEGPFNPDVHRAVDRMPCEEASQAGQVVKVVRPGFRTALQVLRYAEVVVSYHAPGPESEHSPEPETGEQPSENETSENTPSEREE